MTRFVDRGAIFAGWVGVGVGVVLVISVGLVIPVPVLVFAGALPVGALVGMYANQRSERRRPRRRVMANALWAGAMTALALAVFYVAIRMLFVFADAGFPDFNRTDPITGQPIPPYCETGPDCSYSRYVAGGYGPELAAAGVTDGASFTGYWLAGQANGAALLVGLTLGGAAIAGGVRSLRSAPGS